MIRLIACGLLCFVFVASSAQRVRYRDVVVGLDTVSESQQMSMLREYIIEDPNHGNANYRLAILHYNIFRNSDPLLEFKKAMAHAKEASLRLLRAKLLATTQDVRSDNEYYASSFHTFDSKGKPYVEFAVVQQKINNAADSAQKFLDKMPAIFSAFTKSVGNYDRAVKLFAQLNTDYKSLEDIYMFYDETMDKKLEQLKQSYDSSVVYFNLYKSLISQYPLANYNQELRVKNIGVYRMDGLITRLNFLSPEIQLWNYSQWVDGIRQKHREEIAGLKEKIFTTESHLTESLKSLEGSTESYVPQGVSKDLIFQLNNFDKNSLALALLEYKSHKQNLLLKLKSIPRDTALDQKLELYSQLIQLNRVSDTLVSHVTITVNASNVRKHNAFLEKYYGGEKGLDQFVRSEKQWIENSFAQYQDVLKNNLLVYNQTNDAAGKFIRINNFNVPLFVEKKLVNDLMNGAMMTTKITRNPDGSAYVAGVHRMNKKTNFNLIGYVARVNPDGKAAWMKELNFLPDSLAGTDVNNYVGDMVSTKEGCGLVVTSVRQSSGSASNTFVFVSDKGEITNFQLKQTSICRRILFQEANSSFVVLAKGSQSKQQYQTQENIILTGVNVLGDVLWAQEIPLKGIVQDIVAVRDGYVITGNFSMLKNTNGEEIRTNESSGQSNPFLIKLNVQGEIVKIQPILSSKSIFIDRVVKVNDGSINLLGYESTFPMMEGGGKGNLMHMMTTYELKSVCANF
jgi:hypothetical protein